MSKRIATRRRKNVGIGSLTFPWITFMVGYLLASVFDLNQLSGWVSKNLLAHTSTNVVKVAPLSSVDVPKPKFEFYTLLTKEQGKGPEPVVQTPSTMPTKPAMAQAAVDSKPNNAIAAKIDVAPPIDLTVTQKLPLHEPLAVVPPPKSVSRSVSVSGAHYIIQVASFKNLHEAEKMKALLTMRGFSVIITSMTQQRVTWYRVLIGPFESLTDAQRIHREFAQRERITGMIRKLDA